MVHVFLLSVFCHVQPPQGDPWVLPPLEPKPSTQAAPAQPEKEVSESRIIVDLKNQRVIALEGDKKVYNFHCSTGRHDRTPEGDFSVRQKARYNKALPKYGSVPIPYSLKLDIVKNGRRVPIAIHAFGSVPSYPASHGCIRLHYADAKKLFAWAEVGIPVIITRDAQAVIDANGTNKP